MPPQEGQVRQRCPSVRGVSRIWRDVGFPSLPVFLLSFVTPLSRSLTNPCSPRSHSSCSLLLPAEPAGDPSLINEDPSPPSRAKLDDTNGDSPSSSYRPLSPNSPSLRPIASRSSETPPAQPQPTSMGKEEGVEQQQPRMVSRRASTSGVDEASIDAQRPLAETTPLLNDPRQQRLPPSALASASTSSISKSHNNDGGATSAQPTLRPKKRVRIESPPLREPSHLNHYAAASYHDSHPPHHQLYHLPPSSSGGPFSFPFAPPLASVSIPRPRPGGGPTSMTSLNNNNNDTPGEGAGGVKPSIAFLLHPWSPADDVLGPGLTRPATVTPSPPSEPPSASTAAVSVDHHSHGETSQKSHQHYSNNGGTSNNNHITAGVPKPAYLGLQSKANNQSEPILMRPWEHGPSASSSNGVGGSDLHSHHYSQQQHPHYHHTQGHPSHPDHHSHHSFSSGDGGGGGADSHAALAAPDDARRHLLWAEFEAGLGWLLGWVGEPPTALASQDADSASITSWGVWALAAAGLALAPRAGGCGEGETTTRGAIEAEAVKYLGHAKTRCVRALDGAANEETFEGLCLVGCGSRATIYFTAR